MREMKLNSKKARYIQVKPNKCLNVLPYTGKSPFGFLISCGECMHWSFSPASRGSSLSLLVVLITLDAQRVSRFALSRKSCFSLSIFGLAPQLPFRQNTRSGSTGSGRFCLLFLIFFLASQLRTSHRDQRGFICFAFTLPRGAGLRKTVGELLLLSIWFLVETLAYSPKISILFPLSCLRGEGIFLKFFFLSRSNLLVSSRPYTCIRILLCSLL